jgi:hypothetical protein
MYFCGDCGTHVHATDTENPALPVSISGGTVRQKAELRPVAQAWCRSRLPWVSELEEIRQLDRQTFAGGDPRGEPDDRRDGDS